MIGCKKQLMRCSQLNYSVGKQLRWAARVTVREKLKVGCHVKRRLKRWKQFFEGSTTVSFMVSFREVETEG